MNYKVIDGNVASAKGFLASGMNCGVKDGSTKKDVALMCSYICYKGTFTK